MYQTYIYTPLSTTVDDYGNEVTLYGWNTIIARMDFLLSGD